MQDSTVREIIGYELDGEITGFSSDSIGRAHEAFFFTIEGTKYVLKVAEEANNDRFQVEAPVNKLLFEKSDVSVPDIVAFDNSKSVFDVMYFISKFEEGVNLDTFEAEGGPKFPYLSEERKCQVLMSAGRQLGMLHSQTSFDNFGLFKGGNNNLEFRKKDDWIGIFKKIIIEEQLTNFPDRFEDLESFVKEFLSQNIEILEPVDNPCVIHQDFRWPNLKVQANSVSSVFDWERAVSGHYLYDFTKAEKSLLQFKTERSKDKYRKCLLQGYREHMDLKDGWRRIKRFYRALRPVEALWTFNSWTKNMDESTKEEMAEIKRKELKEGIKDYRNKYN